MVSSAAGVHPSFGRLRSNITRLASGTVLSQLLVIGATPLLTRLYHPDAFGLMAIFSSAYAITVGMTTLKLDAAIILPRSGRSAEDITAMILGLISAFALIVMAGLVIGNGLSSVIVPGPLILLPVALWLGATYTLTQQWSARQANYRRFAHSQVIGAVCNVGLALALGFMLGSSPVALILAFTCGMGASLAYMAWSFKIWAKPFKMPSLARVTRRLVAYRQFPLIVFPTALVTTIGSSSMPLLLSTRYGLAEIGALAIANRLMLVPAALIGGALTEAFRAEFVARVRERQSVLNIFVKTLRILAFVTVPAFALLALLAPPVFTLIFGAQYRASGEIGRALALGVAGQFVIAPFVFIFVALRKATVGLCVQIGITIVPLAVLLFCANLGMPLTGALFAYSVATAIAVCTGLTVIYRLCVQVESVQIQQVKAW